VLSRYTSERIVRARTMQKSCGTDPHAGYYVTTALFVIDMSGTVTKLEYQKHNLDRASLYVDGEFVLGLPALEAAKLHVGQHLSDGDIERLRALDTFHKAYERAMHFLSYRARSQAEVRRNLHDAGVVDTTIEAVLERLAQQGWVNDAEFARYWVENREQFRPRGAQALRQELRRKGVDDKTSAEILSGMDQVASAYKAGQPRALRLAALAKSDPRDFRLKLSSFLLRRGFTYDVVRQVVKTLTAELAVQEGSEPGAADLLDNGEDAEPYEEG
jgi:regulatory protein